jgi:hypothetical protein
MQCIHALTRDRECPSQMGHMNQGSLEIVVESTGRVLSVTPPTEPRCYAAASGMLSRCTIPCMGRRASPRAYAAPPPRTKWTRRVPHPVLIGHAGHRAFRWSSSWETCRSSSLHSTTASNRLRAPRPGMEGAVCVYSVTPG